MLRLLKLLGKLGSKLPKLKSHEWDNIFEFIDYYTVVKEERPTEFVEFNWGRVKEILTLLDKVE